MLGRGGQLVNEVVVERAQASVDRVLDAGRQAIGQEPLRPQPPASHARQRAIPVLRPPHALPESQFLTTCTSCGDCINACPYGAISKASARLPGVGGTPIVDPRKQACHMCPDMPCVAACEPGALEHSQSRVMGTATISNLDCLGVQRLGCSVCSERCPVPDAIVREKGIPRIVADACTGCGVCQQVCPAPRNAIILRPRPYA